MCWGAWPDVAGTAAAQHPESAEIGPLSVMFSPVARHLQRPNQMTRRCQPFADICPPRAPDTWAGRWERMARLRHPTVLLVDTSMSRVNALTNPNVGFTKQRHECVRDVREQLKPQRGRNRHATTP